MKPRISAEDFIRTFPGQCNLLVFRNFAAEIQEGGFYISHAWQVVGIHGFIEIICLDFIVTFQNGVMASYVSGHQDGKGAIL